VFSVFFVFFLYFFEYLFCFSVVFVWSLVGFFCFFIFVLMWLQASGGINWRYFLYPDEDSEKTIRKASYSAVDYSISSGLSWRF